LLTYGRPNRPARPWLGLYAAESNERIVIAGIAAKGPAHEANIRPGDAILAVNGESPVDLAGLWRRVWASGDAGSEVTIRLLRDGKVLTARVRSADRASYLKTPRVH
jgi:S1-C subfamily serine protease